MTKQNTAKQQAKQAAETAKEAVENTGLAAPSTSDVEKARKEGVTEAIKEDAKESYEYAVDGNLPGAAPERQFTGMHEIMQYEHIVRTMGLDEFKEAIDAEADDPIPEEKVAGLLELERSGQNRTDYVEALCKRLDVKSPYEVTSAGPGYTNDVSNITQVSRPGED